jgi:hypothetical protein
MALSEVSAANYDCKVYHMIVNHNRVHAIYEFMYTVFPRTAILQAQYFSDPKFSKNKKVREFLTLLTLSFFLSGGMPKQ